MTDDENNPLQAGKPAIEPKKQVFPERLTTFATSARPSWHISLCCGITVILLLIL